MADGGVFVGVLRQAEEGKFGVVCLMVGQGERGVGAVVYNNPNPNIESML